MPSHRTASRNADAQDQLPVEQSQPDHEKGPSDSSPPRAGRTGHQGARAERPAENRAHKSNDGGAEPARKDKPPSPAARDDAPGGGELPQAVRDSAS